MHGVHNAAFILFIDGSGVCEHGQMMILHWQWQEEAAQFVWEEFKE